MAFLADYQGTRILYPNQYCRILDVTFGKHNQGKVTYGIYMQNPNETGEEAHEVKVIDIDTSDYTLDLIPFDYGYTKTKHQFAITQDNV